jgi:uncharacterized protein
MLQTNVLRELRQRIGSVNEYQIEGDSLRVDDGLVEDINGRLVLLRTDRGLLATVDAEGAMETACSRCLGLIRAPVPIEFEEEFVPMVDADTGSPVRLAADEEAFRIDKRFDLDLREALRQYILISEPVKPLCRAECAGLCPACGADLNTGTHHCEQAADERWNALAGLKTDDKEGNE